MNETNGPGEKAGEAPEPALRTGAPHDRSGIGPADPSTAPAPGPVHSLWKIHPPRPVAMAVATIAHKEAAGDLAMVYATKLLDAIKAQLLHELGYEPELVAVAMAEKAKACLERLRGAGYKVEIVRG